MKRCTKCQRELPDEEFWLWGKHRPGRRPACRDCEGKKNAKWFSENGGNGLYKRMRRYGLTRDEAEACMQVPACQICNEPFRDDRSVHFDHCHRHGHLRGVVCGACNMTLQGDAESCMARLLACYDYLLRDMEVRLEPARAG